MDEQHYLLAGLWVGYCVVHSLLASIRVKTTVQKTMGASYKYYRIGYSLFAALTLLLLLYFQFSIHSSLVVDSKLLFPVAFVLLIPGIILTAICIRKYFYELSGLQAIQNEVKQQTLQTGGLHKYVRHPLYLGTLLFVWGLFLLSPLVSHLIACLIITLYTLIGIHLEEKKLYMEFGEAYKRYAKRVPMMIPRFGNDPTAKK
jgi:methanethiol S-methyltransferase